MEFSFNLEIPKDLAALIAAIGGLLAVFRGLVEYTKQGAEKRADRFFKLEKEFLGDPSFVRICELLDAKSDVLTSISYEEKIRFIGFFEQVALLLNSRLIRVQVASYVYGYYAIACSHSEHFWNPEMDRGSPYWSLFFDFVRKMEANLPNKYSSDRLKF